jgi:hypothetical protein
MKLEPEKELETSIQTGETRLSNLQNQYLDGKINSFDEYMNLTNVIDLQLFKDRNALKNMKEVVSPFDEYLNHQVPML